MFVIQNTKYSTSSTKVVFSALTFLILKTTKQNDQLKAMMIAISCLIFSLNFLMNLWFDWRNFWNSKAIIVTTKDKKLKWIEEKINLLFRMTSKICCFKNQTQKIYDRLHTWSFKNKIKKRKIVKQKKTSNNQR